MFRVKIDTPQSFLNRPFLQEQSFLVGVQFAADGHDPLLDIHNSLDHIAELLFSHGVQECLGHARSNNDDFHDAPEGLKAARLMLVVASVNGKFA